MALLDPKLDVVFKLLFTDPRNERLLMTGGRGMDRLLLTAAFVLLASCGARIETVPDADTGTVDAVTDAEPAVAPGCPESEPVEGAPCRKSPWSDDDAFHCKYMESHGTMCWRPWYCVASPSGGRVFERRPDMCDLALASLCTSGNVCGPYVGDTACIVTCERSCGCNGTNGDESACTPIVCK